MRLDLHERIHLELWPSCIACRMTADVNEPPVVGMLSVDTPENQPIGSVLLSAINATDPDIGDSPLFYLIRASCYPDDGSDATSIFGVDPVSGRISLMQAVLDFEKHQTYKLNLNIKDHVRVAGVSRLSASLSRRWWLMGIGRRCRLLLKQGVPQSSIFVTATVNVKDVNEAPVMGSYSMSIAENSPPGTQVGFTVSARDQDVDYNTRSQQLAFSILGQNTTAVPFVMVGVDASSAQVVVAYNVLDFETKAVYVMSLWVWDNGTPALSCNATLTVTLT